MRRSYKSDNKRWQHSRRTLLLITGGVLGVITAAGIAFHFSKEPAVEIIQASSQATEAAPVVPPVIVKPGLPVRIQVPRIKVDARIDHMGLTKSGDMDSPVKIANGGWYKHGPNPGDEGSAVVAGHKTGLKGEPGIFSDLGKVQKGDSIIVTDDKGQSISFMVREVRSYGQHDKPSEVFSSSSGAHLNLITCAGSWNKTDNSFSKRLVVFSDRSD